MAFAQKNNIQIVHIYSDKAISGKTERRTNFQRLMRDAEKKRFHVVIAYKSNRIFHDDVDDVIEWIADQTVSVQLMAMENPNLPAMEQIRAEKKKAIANIVNAIEQGIITDTTKNRLLELEEEVKNLDAKIARAKTVRNPVDREKVIFTLNWLRDGDPKDKEYQRRIIDTFVRKVTLEDDKIRIAYRLLLRGRR